MKEYYKIRYKVDKDTTKIRSVIMSCVDETAAQANFNMAFGGLGASIISVEWLPKHGSPATTALKPATKPAGETRRSALVAFNQLPATLS